MAKEQPIDERLDELREDDGQIYVERDKVDFDPDEGLLSGTAIDGTSDISDNPDDVAAAEQSDGGSAADSDDDSNAESDHDSDDDSGDDSDKPDE
jgi:hypothetical protein